MSEKRKPQLTFHGLSPGECPTLVITVPLDRENAELAEDLVKKLCGSVVPPLTTRRS
jgi:hypothetical protein